MYIDFIICPHRFLSSFNQFKLISIALKKQDVRSKVVELTDKILSQQLPGTKNMEGTKIEQVKPYLQCSHLYLCIDFSSVPSLSNIHT